MVTTIVPSANDVGAVEGDGRVPTEDSTTLRQKAFASQFSRVRRTTAEQFNSGGVVTGFGFSSGDANNIVVTAGEAVIDGYHIDETATTAGTLTPSTFNWVFLALTKSGGLVTGIELQVTTAVTFAGSLASPPADSILLFMFETDATVIVDTLDYRSSPSNLMIGQYIGDDAATRTIDCGFRPKLVKIVKFDTPNRLIAYSELPWPNPGVQQFGEYFYERTPGGGLASGLSDSREIRPQLEVNGFSIEDGPGDIAPGGVLRGVTAAFDPPNIGANGILTVDVTVTGARIGDGALVNFQPASGVHRIIVEGNVEVVDEVKVRMKNTGAAINMSAGDLICTVFTQGGTGEDYKLNQLDDLYFFYAWY